MSENDVFPNAWAVIMAGGSGTRFWPASRRQRPKQLLPLAPGDDRSLLRATLERIAPLVPPERVLVVTSAALADATAAELPELPRANVLAEPTGRNTAPCVGWAASHVRRRDPNGVLMVLPADHHIGEPDAYLAVLRRGLEAASRGALVTVGIEPTRPETGYGYLEVGEEVGDQVHRARRFVEKPNRQRAEQFLAAGNFLWNSGVFFFRASVILDAIATHLPGLGQQLQAYELAAANGGEHALVEKTYATLPSISIDHGVMEKADEVLVVPGSFGWSDLGSWTTSWELAEHDESGNALPADAVIVDAKGNFASVEKTGKVVALVGVSDLVVVDTEDALLILPRSRAQDVRAIVDALKARDDERV
ncbi:MAG: NTP transferase domain-containing protein [Sandaracinus sp.]|nr:NTP transferase domain-containing protein [Sandaracinus sp.]MCB9623059.1 NTP transferase domain-containing protein [Sandaracinus sp.]MCB9634839.1 NTP transferase domain-containing protein [Sandaracinus sp.]